MRPFCRCTMRRIASASPAAGSKSPLKFSRSSRSRSSAIIKEPIVPKRNGNKPSRAGGPFVGCRMHAISGRSQPTDHQLEKVKPHVRTHPRIAAGLTDRERNTGNSHPPKTKAKRSNGDVVPSALLVAEHKNCRDKANGHNHCH
jgi:hypothetical protein